MVKLGIDSQLFNFIVLNSFVYYLVRANRPA